MRHDDCCRTYVDLVFDDDGTSSQLTLAAFALHWLIGAAKYDVLANMHSTANADVGGIFYSTVGIDEGIVANVDVVAVIAMEWVNDYDL